MASSLFAAVNWIWEGTPAFSGGAWTLPLENLANLDTFAYARSASVDPAATRFTVDLGETRRFDTIALAWHNASDTGKVRLTAAGAPPDFDHDFTAGTLPAGWTFTRPSPATCFGPDGLLRTVAPGEPRFDHDPATGAARGILIEESRTNLIAHSNELSAWMGGSNVTIEPGLGSSLDGASNADRATCTGSGGRLQASMSLLAATTYTWSFVATPIVGTFISVVLLNAELGNPEAHFNLGTGAVVFSGGALVGSGSTPLGAAKRRFWITFSTLSGGAFLHEIRFFNVGDSILVSDAQREVGAFPSSFIATTGTATMRAADTLAIGSLSLEWWSSLPLSVHVRGCRAHNKPSLSTESGSFSPAFSAWNGASHVALHIGVSPEYGGPGTSMRAFAGYYLGADLGGDEVVSNQPNSLAAAFRDSSSAMSVNGDTPSTSAASFSAANATTLFIGGAATPSRFDGWLERLTLWTERLPDERLSNGTVEWSEFGGIEWQSEWANLVPIVHGHDESHLPFGRPSSAGRLPFDERDSRGATFLIVLGSPIGARALTVEIDDVANPSGFFQAAMLFIGKAERPEPNTARGVSLGIVESARSARTLAGGLRARSRWRRRRIAGAFPLQRQGDALAVWLEAWRRVGTTRPVLFVLDPDAGIHADRGTIIGVLVEPTAVEHVEHDRWGWAFAIEEL